MTFLPTDTQTYLVALAGSTAQSVFRLVLLLIGGLIASRVLRTLVTQLEGVLVRAGERTGALPGATHSRVATLTGVLRALALVTLWSVIAVIALSQLGLDVRPILAGAGIVGLAVGFGAQYVVRDVIAGFFLVLEDQVRVGDVARVVASHVPTRGSVGYNLDTNVAEGFALLRRGENPSVVLDGIHAKVQELNDAILPKGMRIEPFYDRTRLVSETLSTVHHNLLFGALLGRSQIS